MAQTLHEGSVQYEFPDQVLVFRPEDSTFYTKHWQNFAVPQGGEGNAEIDFVVFDTEAKRLWLLEAKDYRTNRRTKPSEIGLEFARKCRDTLALLGALQVSKQVATPEDIQHRFSFAKMKDVRCVLHVEQARSPRGEWSVISPQNLKDTVKRNLRALDAHALAGDAALINQKSLPFTITL